MNERLYTVENLAELLNCSKSTIWRWVADNKFPKPIKIGGLTRLEPQSIREELFLAREKIQEHSADSRKSRSTSRPPPRRKKSIRKTTESPISL